MRKPRSISSGLGHRGFTLIELLVAAGITLMIAGFIAAIVRNVSMSWTRAGNRLGTDAQARLVLDQLQMDLQAALYRDDGNVWLAADVLNTTGNSGFWQPAARNPKPPTALSLDLPATRAQLAPAERGNIANARFGLAGVWLRFFTTSRGSNNPATITSVSAPVAVAYQIVRRFTSANPANTLGFGYYLHRSEVRPAATSAASNARPGVLESGYDITSAAYSGTGTANNNSGTTVGDPRSVRVPGTARTFDTVIADNVIDFGIRCYVRDATVPGGLRLIFPATATGAPTNATNRPLRSKLPSSAPLDQWSSTAHPFPDVVDVMVRVLTDAGATLLNGTNGIERALTPALTVPQKYNSNAQEWWWGIAQENSRAYTRRIVLNAKPL